MNCYLFLLVNLSLSSLLSTLSSKDLQISTICMKNKHPCIPETLDCSRQFYATSFSLINSIKQLLTIIDSNYSSNQGSLKTFPGVQAASFMVKASSYWGKDESPELARYWTNFGGIYRGWGCALSDANQYIQIGSSIPFVYEKMMISGRLDHNYFITFFKLEYSLDGSNWISYKNSQILVGNSEKKEPVELVFEPFIARSVRILPQSWTGDVGCRFEFFVSRAIYGNVLPSDALIAAVSSGFKLTSSSEWDHNSGVLRAGQDIQIGLYG